MCKNTSVHAHTLCRVSPKWLKCGFKCNYLQLQNEGISIQCIKWRIMLDMLKTLLKIYPDLKPCCSRHCDAVSSCNFTTMSYYLHHPPGLADIQLSGPLVHCMSCHSGNTHLGQYFLHVLALS